MQGVAWTAIRLLGTTLLGTLFYLGSKMDGLGARIDGLSERVDALGARLDARLDGLSARLDAHLDRHPVDDSGAADETRPCGASRAPLWGGPQRCAFRRRRFHGLGFAGVSHHRGRDRWYSRRPFARWEFQAAIRSPFQVVATGPPGIRSPAHPGSITAWATRSLAGGRVAHRLLCSAA